MAAVNRTLALMALTIVLMAGPAAAQGIHGGVLGGVTSSTLSNLSDAINSGEPVDVRRRTGVVIGPFVAFPLNDVVALQLETLYATKGATPSDSFNEVKIELAYLDVPVLLRLTPPASRQFYFLFGPSVNFNISAKVNQLAPTREERDVKDDTRATELGIVFAAGATLSRFLVEGRYSLGLTDIGDTQQLSDSVRNRAFALLLGVTF